MGNLPAGHLDGDEAKRTTRISAKVGSPRGGLGTEQETQQYVAGIEQRQVPLYHPPVKDLSEQAMSAKAKKGAEGWLEDQLADA